MTIAFERKISALTHIYTLHDEFINTQETACRKKCSICCTCNVAMTSLEGRLILSFFQSEQKTAFFKKIENNGIGKRYRPKITINQLAEMCRRGVEPPQEDLDPSWGTCPVLVDDLCPIYGVRPFGCRAMVSSKNCRATGYADMDPFVLTINNLFQQYIEQLDQTGFYGNFTDVLHCLACMEKKWTRTVEASSADAAACRLIPNHPLTAPAIPPEHLDRIQPILEALEQCMNF